MDKFSPVPTPLPKVELSPACRKLLLGLKSIVLEDFSHCGSPSDRPTHAFSHEGSLFSVSIHPEEWSEIARLSGDMWRCEPPKGSCFVSVHSVSKTQWNRIMREAAKLGLVADALIYQAWNYDGESEDWRYSEYLTHTEAEGELNDPSGDDGEASYVKTRAGYVATPTLEAYWHARHKKPFRVPLIDVNDATLACLVDMLGVHLGLWWADTFDPDSLSAPRGGVFQRKLASLTFKCEDLAARVS